MSIETPQSKVLDNLDVGKIIFVDNENKSLSLNERTVEAASNTSAVTITLPEVGTAMGKIFTVTAPNGVTNAVTVNDLAGTSVASLSTDGATAVIYSDGRRYHNIA